MAYVDWKLTTKRIGACSCDPCEFSGRPTRTPCEGVEALEIVAGHFGETRLDGLRVAGVYHWPGAVHEGNGTYQVVVDARASDAQRDTRSRYVIR